MENFEDFIKKFSDRYDYHFVYTFPSEEIKNKVLENKDGETTSAKEYYLNDLKIKDKRIKLLYDIYCDCYQYNIYLCSKLCETDKNFDIDIKYEHLLTDLKQKINNNISMFVIESSDNKIVSMSYAIKILNGTFDEDGDVFIIIDVLIKSLLFKPHST